MFFWGHGVLTVGGVGGDLSQTGRFAPGVSQEADSKVKVLWSDGANVKLDCGVPERQNYESRSSREFFRGNCVF